MQKKTIYAYGGLAFLGIVLLISFASAGFGDWVKGIFGGEPQLGPFNATVTLQSVPPTIVTIWTINDTDPANANSLVVPNEGTTATAYVVFTAHSDNGNGVLPTGVGIPVGTGAAGSIEINIKKGQVHWSTPAYKSHVFHYGTNANTNCREITPCNASLCPFSTLERAYLCAMNVMDYYDEPVSNWQVYINITDTTSMIGPGNSTPFKNWSYAPLTSVKSFTNISWEGLSLSGTNQKATKNLTLYNYGNVLKNLSYIRAFNLTGASYPGINSLIPAFAVKANGTQNIECTGVNQLLQEAIDRPVGGFILNYGDVLITPDPQANSTIFFCIWPQINTLNSSIFPGYQFGSDNTLQAKGLLNNCPNQPNSPPGTCAWLLTP